MAASSFDWPMRLMHPKRARAMRALYGFCRAVDDIADGDLPEADKIQQLEQWRDCLRAKRDLPPDLAEAMVRHALPLAPFEAIIDAMLMDVRGQMCWPSAALLSDYCDGAAGAVGLLAIRILGASEGSAAFALQLGQILQRINILRDVQEDAQRGRVYLPRESWRPEQHLPSPQQLQQQPVLFATPLSQLRADIQQRQKQLSAPRHDRLKLLPAYAMLGVYWQLYLRLPQHHALTRWQLICGVGRGVVYALSGTSALRRTSSIK